MTQRNPVRSLRIKHKIPVNLDMSFYTAVLIEPRRLKVLRHVIPNFCEGLDAKWRFLLYHGTENEEWMKALVHEVVPQHESRFEFRSLEVSNLTIGDYSKRLMSREFWTSMPTETILLFQADTMISIPNKGLLRKFLEYDYVGAPWKWGGIGNGGLSLRKKSKMLQILKKHPPGPKETQEDSYFSKYLRRVPSKIPTEFDAQEFSIETVWREQAFGLHSAWRHLPEKLEELRVMFPGLDVLIAEQGVVE